MWGSRNRPEPGHRWRSLRILALVALLLPSSALGEATPLRDELAKSIEVSQGQLQSMGRDPIVREIPVPDRSRGIAFVALIRLQTDGSALLSRGNLADASARGRGADLMGSFHDPARPEDVASLRFPDDDIAVLADCQVAECKFKTSREGVDSVNAIDWSQEQAAEEFSRRFRKEALDYVAAYRAQGNRALILYADKSTPIGLSDTIESLVGNFAGFQRQAPGFTGYLLSFPEGRRPSMRETILWSIKNFGYRPTFVIDHLVVDQEPETAGVPGLVSVKTLYANHYLAGRLQMGAVLEGEAAFGVPGNFMLLVDRVEFDDELNGLKRSLLGKGLRKDIVAGMKRLRDIADAAQ